MTKYFACKKNEQNFSTLEHPKRKRDGEKGTWNGETHCVTSFYVCVCERECGVKTSKNQQRHTPKIMPLSSCLSCCRRCRSDIAQTMEIFSLATAIIGPNTRFATVCRACRTSAVLCLQHENSLDTQT